MDVIQAIRGRRSIRKYTAEPVSPETVTELISLAMSAPSAGNAQPWQFIVVRSKETLDHVARINPYAAMAPNAPLGILVCGDLSLEKHPGYWIQDCSAAVQNLLLAAHAKGLGAVWTGIHSKADREQAFSELFALPSHVRPLAFIVIGHPAQELGPTDRYDPAKVHQERW